MSDLIARLEATAEDWPANLVALELEAAAALRQMEADLRSTQILLKLENERAFAAVRELAELRAQQPPREPTEEMMVPGANVITRLYGYAEHRTTAREAWQAMYDAARTK